MTIHQFEKGSQARDTPPWVAAFEAAGVEFIDENGGGAGVRLRKRGALSEKIALKNALPEICKAQVRGHNFDSSGAS